MHLNIRWAYYIRGAYIRILNVFVRGAYVRGFYIRRILKAHNVGSYVILL